jgi:hypothetical protein
VDAIRARTARHPTIYETAFLKRCRCRFRVTGLSPSPSALVELAHLRPGHRRLVVQPATHPLSPRPRESYLPTAGSLRSGSRCDVIRSTIYLGSSGQPDVATKPVSKRRRHSLARQSAMGPLSECLLGLSQAARLNRPGSSAGAVLAPGTRRALDVCLLPEAGSRAGSASRSAAWQHPARASPTTDPAYAQTCAPRARRSASSRTPPSSSRQARIFLAIEVDDGFGRRACQGAADPASGCPRVRWH